MIQNQKTQRIVGSSSCALAGLAIVIFVSFLQKAGSQDAPGGTPDYIDLNPVVRDYLGLNVNNELIGSQLWFLYGTALDPQQTGGQPDFGWRQDHKVPNSTIPGFDTIADLILANAGSRPTFYLQPPFGVRGNVGRPLGWTPDPLIDDPATAGWFAPNGALVVGHGLQHFSFKHVAALAASQPPTEKALVAQFMLWSFGRQIGAQLRNDFNKYAIHSSREVGRSMDFIIDCAQLAWIEDDDASTILDWVKFTVLPAIEPDGIGHIYYPGDQGYHLDPQIGEAPYWYPWQDALMAAGMHRFGNYLITIAGNDTNLATLGAAVVSKSRLVAAKVASVVTDEGFCPKSIGLNGNISWDPDDWALGYGAWTYRALRIANAHAKADTIFNKLKNSSQWWPWFVEPNGNWNPGMPW